MEAIKLGFPVIIVFVLMSWFTGENPVDAFFVVVLVGLVLYWIFNLLPLKTVKLDGNYLAISNWRKTERIHLHNISKLEIGSWPAYKSKLTFDYETEFGSVVYFAARQQLGGIGISPRTKSIFTQIEELIEDKKKELL